MKKMISQQSISGDLVLLAEHCARKYHHGQFREYNKLPAVTHPEAVVQILKRYGVQRKNTLAIAWLHDVLEDTPVQYEELEGIFGREIAWGVYLLTRNIDREKYKQRLLRSAFEVQLVKLADTLHNVTTLEQLKPASIKRKLDDCRDFYLPLAKRICPVMGREMEFYLQQYKNRWRDNK